MAVRRHDPRRPSRADQGNPRKLGTCASSWRNAPPGPPRIEPRRSPSGRRPLGVTGALQRSSLIDRIASSSSACERSDRRRNPRQRPRGLRLDVLGVQRARAERPPQIVDRRPRTPLPRRERVQPDLLPAREVTDQVLRRPRPSPEPVARQVTWPQTDELLMDLGASHLEDRDRLVARRERRPGQITSSRPR